MRQEEMDQTRKHHTKSYHGGRKDQENRRGLSSEVKALKNKHSHQSTHAHKKHSKSDHHAGKNDSFKHRKGEEEEEEDINISSKRPKDKNHRSGHRNSPVELIYSGCRNTDSSSSEETQGPINNSKKDQHQYKKTARLNNSSKKIDGQNNSFKKSDGSHHSKKGESSNNSKKQDHSQSRKRRRHEESFEELSDRKKQIEMELKALDAEEAAQAEKRKKRNHSNHHQDLRVSQVRIKEEPLSDDDSNRHKRKTHYSKHSVHIKREEPDDNDDNRRSQMTHSRIKQERDNNDNPPSQKLHTSNSSHRRRDAAGRSDANNMEWGKPEHDESKKKKEVKDKEKPDFKPSGKLAEDTNTFNGVVIKYNEPAEARKPRRRWRLYPFKGDTSLPFIPVHRQSAYLLGRSRIIADIPIDHPSCSKQHAVLQFRLTPYTREDGTKGRSVRPYVIDLDSSNGTFVNNKKIDPRRYMELFEKDVLKFGFSSRVYVILHEESKNEEKDDEGEEVEENLNDLD